MGATAVVMSIVAFVITRKTPSRSIAILLIINGGIILVGMFFIMTQVALTVNSARTVGSTIVMGLLLVALGIVKSFYDKRYMAQRKDTSLIRMARNLQSLSMRTRFLPLVIE